MGIYDRDYYRNDLPRGGFGYFSTWSVTTWLIVINVVVFFADGALRRAFPPPAIEIDFFDESINVRQLQRDYLMQSMGPLERWGYFSTEKGIFHGQIWRLLTFQFLHASGGHIIGNLLGLFFFGPIVEAQFGHRRYLAFYLLCGLAGAVCYLLLSTAGVVVTDPATPLVGASAGVFGLLVAAALIAPHVQVFYYFFPVTIGLLAVVAMAVAAYTVITSGHNAGGEAGHLGGGILGFAIMKNQHWLHWFESPRRPTTVRRRRRVRPGQKDWSKDFNR